MVVSETVCAHDCGGLSSLTDFLISHQTEEQS